MHHPSEGELQARLDNELNLDDASRVADHVAACPECRARIKQLRQASELLSEALLSLDGAAPASEAPSKRVRRLTARRDRGLRPSTRGWGTLARAAVLILVVASAATALVPGSPIRDWLSELVAPRSSDETSAPVEAAPSADRPAAPAPTAVAVRPAGGALHVSLTGFSPQSSVRVRLTDAAEASVRVEGASAHPRYVIGPGRLEVVGGAEGDAWIELPRSVAEATVEVNGEAAVLIREGRLHLLRPAADSLREDVVFRVGE